MSDKLNITNAAQYLGIKEHSLRTAIRKGKISGEMGTVPGTKIPRRLISTDELDEYAANRASVGQRSDGRNKYVVYLTPEELDHLILIMDKDGEFDQLGPNYPARANPPKTK